MKTLFASTVALTLLGATAASAGADVGVHAGGVGVHGHSHHHRHRNQSCGWQPYHRVCHWD